MHAKEARLAIQASQPNRTLHVRTGGAVLESGGGLVLDALLIRKDDAHVRFNTGLARLPTSTGADALTLATAPGAPGLSVQATF